MAEVKYGIVQKGVDYLVEETEKEKKVGLCLPENYSVKNAMNMAYLMLQEAETKDNKPLLTVCTQASIVYALRQMVTQGLNPAKKQCYFVAYGNKCKLLPSYFGTLAILNRVKNLKRQPVANVVREGDVFAYGYDMDTGETKIWKHETRMENLDNPVIAAYAIIETDRERVVEIMSRKMLERSWGQGQSWKSAVKYNKESAAHTNFAEEMSKKTVLNRAAKRLINATDDTDLMGDDGYMAFNDDNDRTVDVVAEQVAEDVARNANTVEFDPAPQIEDKKDAVREVTAEAKVRESVPVSPADDMDEVPDFMR